MLVRIPVAQEMPFSMLTAEAEGPRGCGSLAVGSRARGSRGAPWLRELCATYVALATASEVGSLETVPPRGPRGYVRTCNRHHQDRHHHDDDADDMPAAVFSKCQAWSPSDKFFCPCERADLCRCVRPNAQSPASSRLLGGARLPRPRADQGQAGGVVAAAVVVVVVVVKHLGGL